MLTTLRALAARIRAVFRRNAGDRDFRARRDVRGLPLIETLLRDLRYGVRTLRRDAALTTFAILIIGVGVGASWEGVGRRDLCREARTDDGRTRVFKFQPPAKSTRRRVGCGGRCLGSHALPRLRVEHAHAPVTRRQIHLTLEGLCPECVFI